MKNFLLFLAVLSVLFPRVLFGATETHVVDDWNKEIQKAGSSQSNCAASVSSNLTVHIPIITYNGSYYWADLRYRSDVSILTVANTGIVSNTFFYSNCTPSSLTSEGLMNIPTVIFSGLSYWLDLQWNVDAFKIAGAGVKPEIIAITPPSSKVGEPVSITGTNFGSTIGTVSFNGTTAVIASWSDAEIKTTVPKEATTGKLVVIDSNGLDSNGVDFTVIQDTYTVTPNAGTGGSISPGTPQTVAQGATVAFTAYPDTGYTMSAMQSDCGGTLSGNTFTTAPITSNCNVTATFDCIVSTATASPSLISQTATYLSNAAPASVTIMDNCGNKLAYTVSFVNYTNGYGWISTPGYAATGTGTLTVVFNSTSLTLPGTYTATIDIIPTAFQPITIPVYLTIVP